MILMLTLVNAYNIRAGDIFTDFPKEVFLDSSGDELPVCEEAPDILPAAENPPDTGSYMGSEIQPLRSLHYEDALIDVTLTETESWNCPENLNFTVLPGERDDMLLYQFLLSDSDGAPVHPTGKGQISFIFKDAPDSDDELSPDQDICLLIPYGEQVELFHLAELPEDSASGETPLLEPVIPEDSEKTAALEFTENGYLHRAEFETPYLDNLAFIWEKSDLEHTPDDSEPDSCGQNIPVLSEETADAELAEEPVEEEFFDAEEPKSETEFQDSVIEEMNMEAALAEGRHTSILDNAVPVQEPNNEWQIVSGQYESKNSSDSSWDLQTTTDEGRLFRFQKAVIPTEVENEFLVYLNVEPRMWRKSEYLSGIDIWILGKVGSISGSVSLPPNPTVTDVRNKFKGQVAQICSTKEQAKQCTSGNSNSNILHITTLSLSDPVNGSRDFPVDLYFAEVQGSTASFSILIGSNKNGVYEIYHDVSFVNGVLTIPSSAEQMLPGTYNSMYAKDIPKTIANIPNEYFEILKVTDSSSPEKPVISDGSLIWEDFTYPSGSLIWTDFSNSISSSNAYDFDEISDPENGDIYVYRRHAYELLYRVRLKTEAEGFQSSAEKVFTGSGTDSLYSVIDTAMTEIENKENSSPPAGILPLQFPSPQVRGLLYNIQYKKVDEFEEPLPGVSFTAVSASPDYSPQETDTAVSDADGLLKFTDLSWGTYSVTEAVPPSYQSAGSPPDFTVCYTTDRNAFIRDGDNALYNKDPKVSPIRNTILRTSHTVQKIWKGSTEETLEVTLNASLPADAPEDITSEALNEYLARFAFSENKPYTNFTQYSHQTLTADSSPWTYTWKGLPANYICQTADENGTVTLQAVPIVYTVTEVLPEDVLDKYDSVTEESDDGSMTIITNTARVPIPETTTHTVKKVWTDETKKEDSLKVELKACYTLPSDSTDAPDSPDFTATPETQELTEEEYTRLLPDIVRIQVLTESEDWKYIWENLPAEYIYPDSDGTEHTVPLTYTVEEHLPPDAAGNYITSTVQSPDGLVTTITNSPTYELPSAGGPGIFRFFTAGVLLMMASVYLAFHGRTSSQRRRRV